MAKNPEEVLHSMITAATEKECNAFVECPNDTPCPQSLNYRLAGRPWFLHLAFRLTGGDHQYMETSLLNPVAGTPYPMDSIVQPDLRLAVELASQAHCKQISFDTILNVSDLIISGKSRRIREKIWVNFLIGRFISGSGHQNILFHPNCEVSQFLVEARLVKRAVRRYQKHKGNAKDTTLVCYMKFGIPDLITVIARPWSVKHFIGSSAVSVSPHTDSTLLVTIFNITSITSADYSTHYKIPNRWPKSIPRGNLPHPYSNTSQIYQLIVPAAPSPFFRKKQHSLTPP